MGNIDESIEIQHMVVQYKNSKDLKEAIIMPTIKETKCTCQSCGKIWYYGKQEVIESFGNSMSNCGKSMMCCTGCMPAALIPDKKVVDYSKCPECNSKAVIKEEVFHDL